jgi:hypothetical protein
MDAVFEIDLLISWLPFRQGTSLQLVPAGEKDEDNLMNYGTGIKLRKFQWDIIQTKNK